LTLTLDPDVVRTAKTLLRAVPGLSLSQLVDQLLRAFIVNTAPAFEKLEAATTSEERLQVMHAMFGQHVLFVTGAFNEAAQTLKGEDEEE